jgi:hypothetical protein
MSLINPLALPQPLQNYPDLFSLVMHRLQNLFIISVSGILLPLEVSVFANLLLMDLAAYLTG